MNIAMYNSFYKNICKYVCMCAYVNVYVRQLCVNMGSGCLNVCGLNQLTIDDGQLRGALNRMERNQNAWPTTAAD